MLFSAVLLVLVLAWVSGVLARRIGYPPVLGELAAGVIFGPPVLGLVAPNPALTVLGSIGVALLMIYIGMQVDPAELAKSAAGALAPALAGLAIPAALGYVVVTQVGGSGYREALIVGVILGTTALATVSRILLDIDMLQKPLGQQLLIIALLEVVLVLLAFAIASGAVAMDMGMMDDAGGTHIVLAKAGAFLAAAIIVGKFLLRPLGKLMIGYGLTEGAGTFTFAIAMGLLFAAASDAAGLSFVPGAFLAGLFIDKKVLGEPFDATITAVRDAGVGFLTPVFFFTAGFQADLSFVVRQPVLLVAIIAAAFGGKVLAGIVGSVLKNAPWREGALIGFGMNGRGGIDIIMAGLALNSLHVIDTELFTALVLTTFVTTIPVPILLQKCAGWMRPVDPAHAKIVL